MATLVSAGALTAASAQSGSPDITQAPAGARKNGDVGASSLADFTS